MRPNFHSFVLLLVLTATACTVPAQSSSVQQVGGSEGTVLTFNSTSTPTAQPSPTNTLLSPTETRTPRPPTNTPAQSVQTVKVIGEGIVNIRSGPCNHPILTEATPGMEFIVTGRYTSPGEENWWRIQYSTRSGALVEGWIWGKRVEVTSDALVPFVPSQCPPFPTPTSDKPEQAITPTTVNSPPVILPACETSTWQVGGVYSGRFLWPELVTDMGDREFDGNGPRVNIEVYVGIDVRKGVWGRIKMQAIETKADYSTAVGDSRWFRLHEGASAGWRVTSVNLTQVDPATGLYYSKLEYIDDDHDLDVYRPKDGGPVRSFVVTGDTKGDDIGSGEGDTHVLVGFNEIRVDLIQEGNCQ
jgi:hypothetical protein